MSGVPEPQHQPPRGMEPYDLPKDESLGALSSEQQEKLNDFKTKVRVENENYMRKHPEVECLISGFLSEVLEKRPDNIRQFAAAHFTDPHLPKNLEALLEERQQRLRVNKTLRKL